MALTPQTRLREVIVQVLEASGGRGTRANVLQRMAIVMNDEFTAEDLEPVRTRPHEVKWQNRASYERASMIREGLLERRDDGIWALTK